MPVYDAYSFKLMWELKEVLIKIIKTSFHVRIVNPRERCLFHSYVDIAPWCRILDLGVAMDRLLQAVSPSEEAVEEAEGAVEVLRVEEYKGEVEAAVVALEGPHGQGIDVQQAANLVRRQTEVTLIGLSLFCYVTIVT